VRERCAQVGWILDHRDDLDADFLAIYGIDLEEREIDGRRYVQFAQRLAAFDGVIAARIAQTEAEERPAAAARPGQAPAGPADTEHVELAQLRLSFPGVVSMTRATE
jgi:hypothetical protein